MGNLKKMMEQRSTESRKKIMARVEELRQEIGLSQLREELNMSQTQLAVALGVKQPTVAKMEQPDNDPRLSTLKRYVAALGGELSLDVTLPDGKRVAFHI